MTVFEVTAEHTPRGWWVLEAPQVGAVSQVRRLAKAADEMREAIAHLAGVPESEVDVKVVPVLPDAFSRARQEAARLRADADRLNNEAAAANSEAARTLHREGMSVRDIGDLMGVSFQRASQLVRT